MRDKPFGVDIEVPIKFQKKKQQKNKRRDSKPATQTKKQIKRFIVSFHRQIELVKRPCLIFVREIFVLNFVHDYIFHSFDKEI